MDLLGIVHSPLIHFEKLRLKSLHELISQQWSVLGNVQFVCSGLRKEGCSQRMHLFEKGFSK